MARIPEAEIERLKAEVSVQRLAEARGIKLERRGADLIGLCPFHEDHEPSLVITPAKNLWHCLGACRTGGSVIDWVMKSRGVSFRQGCVGPCFRFETSHLQCSHRLGNVCRRQELCKGPDERRKIVPDGVPDYGRTKVPVGMDEGSSRHGGKALPERGSFFGWRASGHNVCIKNIVWRIHSLLAL
jgi:hypothetical protein